MGALYQITINGIHRQTCYALNDQDAQEIALRWFNNEQPTKISTSALQPNENASHLQTHIEE